MPVHAEVFLKRSSLACNSICNLCMITKEHVYELFFNFFGALFLFCFIVGPCGKIPSKIIKVTFSSLDVLFR